MTDDPLQERMYTKYARIDRFIPRGEFNQGSIDCIAYSPNYPDIIVTNNITLDVERKVQHHSSIYRFAWSLCHGGAALVLVATAAPSALLEVQIHVKEQHFL